MKILIDESPAGLLGRFEAYCPPTVSKTRLALRSLSDWSNLSARFSFAYAPLHRPLKGYAAESHEQISVRPGQRDWKPDCRSVLSFARFPKGLPEYLEDRTIFRMADLFLDPDDPFEGKDTDRQIPDWQVAGEREEVLVGSSGSDRTQNVERTATRHEQLMATRTEMRSVQDKPARFEVSVLGQEGIADLERAFLLAGAGDSSTGA